MFWSQPARQLRDADSAMRRRLNGAGASVMSGYEDAASQMEDRASELATAALAQVMRRIDILGDALADASAETASSARSQVGRVRRELANEVIKRPVRALLIAVGIGVAAALYRRK